MSDAPAVPNVVTEPLGGAALAALAAAGAAPAGWYPPRPTTPAAWRARAAQVSADVGDGWLDRLRPALGGGPLPERLERAAAAGGVVVTTGQQPGLFGGPIYTWTKALSALALADALEAATGVAAAPVFWAATDDADFAEASVTHVAVPGGVDTLRMAGPPTDGVPMARVPLGDVGDLVSRLERGAGSAAFADVLAANRAAYAAAGATVGSAYLTLLRALLEPLGVAVLDASHPAVRAAGAATVRRALARGPAIEAALAARVGELAAAGHPAQVATVPGLTLVFATSAGDVKQRVPHALGERLAATAPDDALGPNVLLRPVMERAILPTVAYVAGPGEIAYFAQVSAVADALGLPAPLAVPRWSATVVEPHVARVLAQLGVGADDLRDTHAVEARLARAAMPGALRAALAAARVSAGDAIAAVGRAPGGDVVTERVRAGAQAAVDAKLDRLERRYLAAYKRQEAATMRDLGTARGALWPLGKRQERTLNFLPLLARHGPPLLDAMRDRAAEHARGLVGDGASPAGAAVPAPGAAARAG